MKIIATLGPAGTFADIATHKYLEEISGAHEVKYYASIKLALNAIGKECDVTVLPIENFSEGFIPILLDALAKKDAALYMGIKTIPDYCAIFCLHFPPGGSISCPWFLDQAGANSDNMIFSLMLSEMSLFRCLKKR